VGGAPVEREDLRRARLQKKRGKGKPQEKEREIEGKEIGNGRRKLSYK